MTRLYTRHREWRIWVAAAFAVVLGFGPAAHAALVINFAEVGNDVVAVGSGSANTAGASKIFDIGGSQVNLDASSGNYRGGQTGVAFSAFSISGPADFGPGDGSNNVPSLSSGDYFGLTGFNGRLLLPTTYVSGTSLHNSSTWLNRTFGDLGLAKGAYVYTWGSGDNADTLTVNIPGPVPEPASLSLLASGAVLILRRRSRS